jgi:hypothetical protein
MKTWIQKTNLRRPWFNLSVARTMINGWGFLLALAFWVLTFPAAAVAQGWYWGSPVAPGYDRASVVEVSGSALQVDISQRGGGSTLRVESGGEIYTVTLGPGWYLRQQGADYKIGDKLAVKGSKMKTQEGKLYLTAAKIKNLRTGRILELRDENGLPLWKSKRRFDKEGSREGKP